MYSVRNYGEMIADDVRTDAYVRAIRQAVRPGCVVLDIGTGTGLFAILAAQFGARRVYAVDSADIIEVARSIAADNGCAGSIEFFHARSTDITLPEPADVIVSDLRGILPFYESHLPSIADARKRFLAAGGVLIPQRDTLWIACVEAPDLHRAITTPWSDNKYGLDMEAARKLVANQWRRAAVKPEQIMSEPQCCGSIDYSTVEDANLHGAVALSASRAGTAHGLCAWFDTILIDGVHLSNSPGMPDLIYGNAYFPWPEPVELEAGDTVSASLKADVIGGEYLWTWETRICRAAGRAKLHFKQSDFFALPWSLAKLLKQSTTHVPALNDEGRIDRLILQMMDEENSLEDIARHLESRFPGRFAGWREALTRVGELSSRYSR
jgi:protein arginine N-methyltransferase 1